MLQELSPMQKRFDALTCFVIKRPIAVFLIAVLLGGFGVWRAGELKISQDLKKLIPDDYPSVVQLEKLSERVGSQSEFIIEIRSPNRDANIKYGTQIAEKLRIMDNAFQFVEFRREVDWFSDNALLFVPVYKLLDLRRQVIAKIRKEVSSEVVETIDDETPKPTEQNEQSEVEDPWELDDETIKKRYGRAYDVPQEYIETDDGEVLVVRGRPIKGTTDVAFTNQIMKRVRTLLKEQQPSNFHPEMIVAIRGEYEERSGQVASIKDELLGSSLYALAMLLVVLGIHFKRLRAIPLILLPLILSILTTVGVTTLLFNELNLVTAFIFVVLLGLGIDFGIHILARYEYERLRGASQEEAIRITGAVTGLDVSMGALTTVAMFSLFPIADFRGFSQFGKVACIGVSLALIFNLMVLPALIILIERVRAWQPRQWLKMESSDAPPSQRRGLAATMVVLSILLAAFSLWKAPAINFEYDFTKLGRISEKSAAKGPDKQDYADAIGRPDYGPAMALADTADDGRRLEDILRGLRLMTDDQIEQWTGRTLSSDELKKNNPDPELLAKLAASILDDPDADEDDEDDDPFAKRYEDPFKSLIEEVVAKKLELETQRVVEKFSKDELFNMRYLVWKHLSLWSFVPSRQKEKLRIIKDMKRRVDAKFGDFSDESKNKVKRLRRYLKVKQAVSMEGVPVWVRNRWTDSEGIYGRHAILWNRGAKADYNDAKRLYEYLFTVDVGSKQKHEVKLAANYFVLPEIMDTLMRDGPRVLGAAMIAIFLCLMIMFRSLRLVILILVPLTTAVAWLAGLFWLLEWKLNLYNVITFSLIVGMGVDDGIHMVSRWLEDGCSSVDKTVRETGSAVFLTTLTTCIGFGGLLFARHVGLNTLGWTAAVGMMLCLIASMTTLPALLILLGKKKD